MMNSNTVRLLNQLNQEFYKTVASHFDATRTRPWTGWFHLLPYIKNCVGRPESRVLDLGCGNARFGLFLYQELSTQFQFVGVDSSRLLLERAAEDLAPFPHQLIQADLLSDPITSDAFDLIAVFGVMHHIPGHENRKQCIETWMQKLKPGGRLVFTCWVFYELERFRKRIVPWDWLSVPQQELEPHDYLLDWRQGETAVRYCHYIDRDELAQLVEGHQHIITYDADTANRYVILAR